MPTYGYQCTECQFEFQAFQSMKDDPIAICPECAGSVKRLLYPVGIVFKGSGWHINDYRKPEPSSEGGDKAETSPKAESKSETKSEPAAPAASASASETK